jgi:phenylacetate-CoA ligase
MSIEDLVYKHIGRYKQLPDGVKAALTLPFRALPRSLYLGRTYRETLALALRMEHLSAADVQDYQWQEMRHLLDHCYRTVPHYGRTWRECGFAPQDIRSFDEFRAKVPFVTRDMVQANPADFVSTAYPRSRRLPMNTGGSTGKPLLLYYLKGHTRAAEWGHMHAQWRRFGHRPGSVMANLRGEFLGRNRAASYDPWRKILMLSSFALTAETADAYLDLIRRHRVEFINGYPSSLHLLTQLSQRTSVELPSLRGIILASENILDWQVADIEGFFGKKDVIWHYGHGEVAALGGTCETSRRYHFMPSYGYVEWGPGLAEHANSVEIVATSFINPLMPLVRYRTQDYGILDSERCPCGRNHVQLARVIGRAQELAIGDDNRAISLTALVFGRHARYFNHVRQLQIVNTAPGRLIVRVVAGAEFTAADEREIVVMLSHAQGMPFETTVERVEHVELTKGGKQRFLIREFPWPQRRAP